MRRKKVNYKNHIMATALFILGLAIGSALTFSIISIKAKKTEDNKISESPYTLNEINEIIENPTKFYELNDYHYNEFNYIITHFYDYFSKDTEFLIATKVEENDGKVTKIIETKKIPYKDYIYLMSDFYQLEEQKQNQCEEKLKSKDKISLSYEDCIHDLDYQHEAISLVYGSAEGFFKETTDEEWEELAKNNPNIHLD